MGIVTDGQQQTLRATPSSWQGEAAQADALGDLDLGGRDE